MIYDPVQPVECDKCGAAEQFSMTALVQQSWDNRNLAAKLKRAGWVTRDERHFCPECVALEKEEADSDSADA